MKMILIARCETGCRRKIRGCRRSHGEGRVVDTQVLTQLVVIQADDGSEYAVPLEEVTIMGEASGFTAAESQDRMCKRSSSLPIWMLPMNRCEQE